MISQTKSRLIAAVAFPLLLLHAAPSQARSAPAVTAETRLDHISIVERGTGSPVVLIPGLASPRAVWDGVAPSLAANHRVILVQVNGFAGDAPGANLNGHVLDGIVADLDRYLTAHRATGAAVVGHSMGGLVGMMLAKAHPADVARLMIVDSLPYFAVLMAPPGVDPTPAMVEPQAAKMRDGVAAGYGKPVDPAMLDKQTRVMALTPDAIAKTKVWAAAADMRVAGQAMYEDLTTDLRPDLPALKLPITLVYPWNPAGPTKAMTDPFYRRQYAGAPNVTYVDVGNAAHFVMLDQPAAFAKALDSFLAS